MSKRWETTMHDWRVGTPTVDLRMSWGNSILPLSLRHPLLGGLQRSGWRARHDAQQYVERYDAVTQAVLKVAPAMKFVGLALSSPSEAPKTFAYFLDPKNHQPGVPLDYISFHGYATPSGDETLDDWQYTFFDQASEFVSVTRYILQIRDLLSPSTKIMVDEAGSILNGDMSQGEPGTWKNPFRQRTGISVEPSTPTSISSWPSLALTP